MIPFNDLLSDFQWISLLIFVFFTVVILVYYWLYYSRIAFRNTPKANASIKPDLPVSVVICARNEYENLKSNLPLVLEQNYPAFEVILVNDFSEDDSYFFLKSLQEKYHNFNVINLRENVNFFAGKKLALALGIKSAKFDTILLTDADCSPASQNWISEMMSAFDDKTEIVLGYGGYRKIKGFLNNLIRFDTVSIAVQYLGFALAGKPYMGVGRNLAYKKELFFRSGGFTSHYKINSGDDDLFVNKTANRKNTQIVIHPDSFTLSEPKKSFGTWFKQKKRHLSTGGYYKAGDKFRLGLLAFSNTMFYISLVVFLALAQSFLVLYIAAGLVFLKFFSLMLIYYYAGKRFNEPKLFLYSPIFDMIFAFLNPVFAISNLFYRKNKWK
ncbi:MAG: glycosyltransferase [Bacteroidales bacterium]|nr:glycosyltransferase [Bacteroidales bacterium]